MHILDLGDVELLALHLEIDGLAAGHPERAARFAEQVDQAQAHRRGSGQRRVAGQELKRQRLQGIADQDRGGLVEGFVARRASAAQIVIVHRGQVIVHQRIDVDQLDGTRGCLDLVLAEPQGARGRE